MERRDFLKNAVLGTGFLLCEGCTSESDIINTLQNNQYTIDQAAKIYAKESLTAQGIGTIKEIIMVNDNTFHCLIDVNIKKLREIHTKKLQKYVQGNNNNALSEEAINQLAISKIDFVCELFSNHVAMTGETKILMNNSTNSYPSPTGKMLSSINQYYPPNDNNNQSNKVTLAKNKYGLVDHFETLQCKEELMNRSVVSIPQNLFDSEITDLPLEFIINNKQDIIDRYRELDQVTENFQHKNSAFIGIKFECLLGGKNETESVVLYMPIDVKVQGKNVTLGLKSKS